MPELQRLGKGVLQKFINFQGTVPNIAAGVHRIRQSSSRLIISSWGAR
jgi:hypothetical protein